MRRLAGVLAAAVLLGGLVACGDDEAEPPGRSDVVVDTPELRDLKAEAGIEPCVPGPGGDLPELELPCLGGGPAVGLDSLRGPLVINLWNTACGPCRKEMPALQEFHERYGDEVGLLGLDVTDTSPGDALRFADLVGATYPQLADPGGDVFDLAELGLRPAFPQFLFVDADGRLAGPPVASGGLDSVDDVVALVEENLGVEL